MEVSAWVNAWKSFFCASGEMPMPVSFTSQRKVTWDAVLGCLADTNRNFAAVVGELDRVAQKVVENLPQSVRDRRAEGSGVVGSTQPTNSIFLVEARSASNFQRAFQCFPQIKFQLSKVSFRASIFEKSRISLMTVSSEFALRRMVSAKLRCLG